MAPVAACTDRGERAIESALAAQVHADGRTVDLAKLVSDPWDRACILGPYSNNDIAAQVLGFPWNVQSLHANLATQEGIQVLVFANGRAVIASSEHRRGDGDFVQIEGQCLRRPDAMLSKRSDESGWLLLVRDAMAARDPGALTTSRRAP